MEKCNYCGIEFHPICGKPGTWRAQYFGSFEVLGWVLCDECAGPRDKDLSDILKGGKK